jgi:YidC/Oxa1 family membrane protein insertase
MDRNTITGLVLIFAILIVYSIWMAPDREELDRRQHIQDSLQQVQLVEDSLRRIQEAEILAASERNRIPDTAIDSGIRTDSSIVSESLRSQLGVFASLAQGKAREVVVETPYLKLNFSTKGARITQAQLKRFQTWDSLPLILFGGDSAYYHFSFFSANRLINSEDLFFSLQNEQVNSWNIGEDDSLKLVFRAYPEVEAKPDAYIELSYTILGNDYMLKHQVQFHQMDAYIDSRVNYLTLDWGARLRQQEKSQTNERSTTTVYYKHLGDDVDYLSERKDAEESIKTRLRWVAFKQQFFSMVLIADQHFVNADLSSLTENDRGGRYLKTARASISIPFNDDPNEPIALSLYLGPNRFNRLKQYEGLELENMIPLGWMILSWINKGIVIPVFDWLEGFNWNYGIIILVLTILLKIVLFPIPYKTYISSAKMRVLRPEVEEIAKKFPDQKDSMKKQQATMDLYRKAGVNPMAGCVPMLLQLPILIALFRFFPASIELRQQSFLWADDLSTYDSILDLPFNIPFYGDHVSLFTLLMTISTLIYTRINNQMMSTGNQMPGMKTMMYMMPIMFLGFFNSYASGLSYYYFLANMITFGQMYIFRLLINEDKLRAKIEQNKKKPRKKSAFQRRLEDMQKQQQQVRKRR